MPFLLLKLLFSYAAQMLPHNLLLHPTYFYFAPLHSTLSHIIDASVILSSTNVLFPKYFCGLFPADESQFSLRPVVLFPVPHHHIWYLKFQFHFGTTRALRRSLNFPSCHYKTRVRASKVTICAVFSNSILSYATQPAAVFLTQLTRRKILRHSDPSASFRKCQTCPSIQIISRTKSLRRRIPSKLHRHPS